MPRMSREEKIKHLEQQEAAIKAQKRQLLAQENAQKRRERTRRLIQIGAIALKYFDLPDTIEPKDFEQYIYSSRKDGETPSRKSL